MKLPIDVKHYVKVILFFLPELSSKQVSDMLARNGHIISPASVAGIKSHMIEYEGWKPGENGEYVQTYSQDCGSHEMNIEIKCSLKK